MVVLLWMMWATFVLMIALELRRQSPALLFVLGLILAAGLPLTVLYVGHGPASRPSHADEMAVQYIVVFNLVFLLMRFLLPVGRVVPVSLAERDTELNVGERRVVAIVAGVFSFTLFLKLAGAGFSLSTLMSRTWREGSGFDLLMTYTAHTSFGLVLCFVYLRRFGAGTVALLAVTALLLVDRSRALALAAFGPLLYFSIPWAIQGRTRFIRVGASALLGLFAILGFYLVQEIRYLGALTALPGVGLSRLAESAFDRLIRLEGDLSLAQSISWLMSYGEQVDGYGQGTTFVRMLLFWVPAALKPPELTHSIAAAYVQGGAEHSYHPTIYGLAWADARWAGIAYAGFLAGVFYALDRVVQRFSRGVLWTILLGPYSVFAVLAARGSLYNAWVTLVVTMTVLLALYKTMRVSKAGSPYHVAKT